MRVYYPGNALKKIIGVPSLIVPDFTNEFEMIGRLAKYFKGGFSIPEMEKRTFEDVFFYYKIYERQIAERVIIDECKDKNIPEGLAMENRINRKIKKWHKVEVEE